MNKRQKHIQQRFLDNEEAVIAELEKTYRKALRDIDSKIAQLMARPDADMQHVIYQVEYQKALKKQISGILDAMQAEEFTAIADYLQKCYEDGFIGTMYDLHGQGIPMCFPMDQESIVRAVQLDSKISKGLYSGIGEDVAELKKNIAAEVSRGISTGASYAQVALQIKTHMVGAYTKKTGGALYRAQLIARTEGHRVQVQATMDACTKARDKGADVVKQWDATLDKRTRKSHQKVDGEIREINEPFSNGLMFPGDPDGGAAEVCNCRCALLQRARWALDDDELETLKQRAEYFGLDKTKNFEEFRTKYIWATEEEARKRQLYADTVISDLIKTPEYRKRFELLDESVRVRRVACAESRAMLEHRSGTKYEDMTFIDSRTGKFIRRSDYDAEREVMPNKKMREMVMSAEPHTIISVHNHPGNSLPSMADIKTAYLHQYKYGLIACHDGRLIKYEVLNGYDEDFTEFLLVKADESWYNNRDKFAEHIKQLEEIGVKIEVIGE